MDKTVIVHTGKTPNNTKQKKIRNAAALSVSNNTVLATTANPTNTNSRQHVKTSTYLTNVEKYSISSCSSRDHESFKRFSHLVCSETESDYSRVYVAVLWIWAILSCYSTIRYTEALSGNSGNAKFGLLEASSNDNVTESIFVKFQISEQADDMLVDNINGYILNILTQNKSKHFMTYIDSCMTCVRQVEKNKFTFPLKSIMSRQNTCNNTSIICQILPPIEDKSLHLVKASFHKTIPSDDNLEGLIYSMLSAKADDRLIAYVLTEKLGGLFTAIRELGEKYGFCHNDAHLGNILLDSDTSKLVLIDYGRAMFNPDRWGWGNDQRIRDRLTFEMSKNNVYGECTQQIPRYDPTQTYAQTVYFSRNMMAVGLKDCLNNFDNIKKQPNALGKETVTRNPYMFDLMTISMCLIHMLAMFSPLDGLDNFIQLEFKQNDAKRRIDRIWVADPSVIAKGLLSNKEFMRRHKYRNLVPGMYWYSLVCKHLCNCGTKLRAFTRAVTLQGEFFTVECDELKKLCVIHTSFQLLAMPLWDEFFSLVADNIGDVNQVLAYPFMKASKDNSKQPMDRQTPYQTPVVQKMSIKSMTTQAGGYMRPPQAIFSSVSESEYDDIQKARSKIPMSVDDIKDVQ